MNIDKKFELHESRITEKLFGFFVAKKQTSIKFKALKMKRWCYISEIKNSRLKRLKTSLSKNSTMLCRVCFTTCNQMKSVHEKTYRVKTARTTEGYMCPNDLGSLRSNDLGLGAPEQLRVKTGRTINVN